MKIALKIRHHDTNPFTLNTFLHLLISLSLFSSFSTLAQSSYDNQVRTYIDAYKGIVVQDMRSYGIPASIKLAQAIVESRAGLSPLATEANNHFGIKCHREWTGNTYLYDDDAPRECFRKYDNAVESFRDHSEFLTTRPRYQFLFSLDVRDYRAWAYGLRTAGYATNPNYAETLIQVIERYALYQYDLPQEAVAAVIITQADENLLEAYRALFSYFAPGPNGRAIYLNNHVQCTFALAQDDLLKIARDFRIKPSNLMKFNDLKRTGGIREGQVIYLQKKKRKTVQEIHVVGLNQSLWEIAQVYGIRLDILLKRNKLPPNFQAPAGKMLKLR